MDKVKVIIIGNSQKVSLAMRLLLQDTYNCKIEFVSADEFKASGLKAEDVLHIGAVPKPKENEFFELSKVPQVKLSDVVVEKKKNPNPYNPKTIGKINSRKMNLVQRCNNKRLKSR